MFNEVDMADAFLQGQEGQMGRNGNVPRSKESGGERLALLKEIDEIRFLKKVFESLHIRGAVFDCELCHEKHYIEWDLIVDGLKQNLEIGVAPVHEPAVAPDPTEYVSWDYARGLLDGFESVGGPAGGSLPLILDPSDNDRVTQRGRR